MTTSKLDGSQFTQMILLGAQHLANNAEKIDALNVFPVPDGDTGTNMNLSLTSGADKVKNIQSDNISEVSQAFSKGLLMGARGNSGVILSQIFRGFSQGIGDKRSLTTNDLAIALQEGVTTAYKAVMKPVEGTILTVAKDSANIAVQEAKTEQDIIVLMDKVVKEAKASLKRTPDLLPILKEVGVVDSGGQGLLTIYEGFLAFLKGEDLPELEMSDVDMTEMINAEHHKIAQDFMSADEIEYGYCTEFMVQFETDKLTAHPFQEDEFKAELLEQGDSLVVVADTDLVRVHVHTEYPGNVMTMGQRYGSLVNIDIENMREQHTEIMAYESKNKTVPQADYALITVAMGSGIKSLFESLGVTVIIEGGQTMNPSTQDISDAIKQANAKKVIILPNNKNIVMAAEQAADLAGENVRVVSTTSIPQGITACLSFHPDSSLDENQEAMMAATGEVKSGQVTYAVRDTKINGIEIDKGNFMGLADGQMKVSDQSKFETVKQLLSELIDGNDEILTILYGEDIEPSEIDQLEQYVEQTYSDVEVEIHEGKQPIYSYILAVE